jgi:hypothetical protein
MQMAQALMPPTPMLILPATSPVGGIADDPHAGTTRHVGAAQSGEG